MSKSIRCLFIKPLRSKSHNKRCFSLLIICIRYVFDTIQLCMTLIQIFINYNSLSFFCPLKATYRFISSRSVRNFVPLVIALTYKFVYSLSMLPIYIRTYKIEREGLDIIVANLERMFVVFISY